MRAKLYDLTVTGGNAMAWSGIIRMWDGSRRQYRQLILRFEETPEPGCLARLYDGEAVVGEGLADSAAEAVAKVVQLARDYLHDSSITAENVDWVQL